MQTEKLYYQDPHLREFTATILEKSALADGQFAIILDRTAFYPEGGGQPCDTGSLNEAPVLSVQTRNGDIIHTVACDPGEGPVTGRIDWQRRFDHMQQHTGEHILSGIFLSLHQAENVGFHLSATTCQIDVTLPSLSPEQAQIIEDAANAVIFSNRPIDAKFVETAELSAYSLRKEPGAEFEQIRLVSIQNCDCCPCGGTHVSHTGEVGLLKIRGWEKRKNNIRVEFACGGSTENSAYGPTTHPLDETRVAGGSSGGSAAAVADGSVVWALGTDTGGSIRQPASFCGVVGLKPTYGRVSRYGVIAMGSSLDQVGPITKTVEDAAIVLSRIAGRDANDATSAASDSKPYEDYCVGTIAGAKIGIPKEYLGDGLDARVREQFLQAVEKYKELGAEIVDVSLPHTRYALAVYYIIMPCELSSNLARFDGLRYGGAKDDIDGTLLDHYLHVRGTLFGPEVKRRIMLGTYALSAGYYDAYYKKAQKVRALIKKDFHDVFTKVNYVFTPTAPEVAFKRGSKTADPLTMYLSDIYTVTANLAGVPALSLPIGTVEDEGVALPVGGQLIGSWFDEEGILNAGHTYEIATTNV